MIIEIEPWLKHPDLKQEHLTTIANLLRDVRKECVRLHEPDQGDGNWCLGTRVYQRSCFHMRALADKVDWLTINPEQTTLCFSFRVGVVPMRFYKGDFKDPPSRYLAVTYGEEYAQQLCLDLEYPEPEPATEGCFFRLAVAVDANREVASVTFVEIDDISKEPVGMYQIPFERTVSNVTPMQAPPVTMPPAIAEPLTSKEEKIKEVPKHVAAS